MELSMCCCREDYRERKSERRTKPYDHEQLPDIWRVGRQGRIKRPNMNTILKYYANQGTLARLENKWIVNYSRNRSLSYVIEQNKSLLCSISDHMVICYVSSEHTKSRLFFLGSSITLRTLLEYQLQN